MLRTFPLWTCLALTLAAGSAAAGDDPTVCDQAELTLDGKTILLRPGCAIHSGLDTATGKRIDAKAAAALAADAELVPLLPVEAKDALGKWLTRQVPRGDAQVAWVAVQLPGTDWLVRYKRRGPYGSVSEVQGPVQYAPLSAFKEAFAARKDTVVAPAGAVLPKLGPFGTGPAADLAGVFTVGPTAKRKGLQTVGRTVTYDAAEFKRRVPTLGDLLRHARIRWKYVGSESGTTGWRVERFEPRGFWGALGYTKPGFRVVTLGSHPANGELHRVYEALSTGKPVSMRTFVPYEWTLTDFVPK